MGTWKPLNMSLRCWVIERMLRLEQTSSDLLKLMLRMPVTDSKTLGNQSSALSFRSKIDLLLDLEEIDKAEYSHLLKLMEIRNQFAHNHNAVSFESFDTINNSINTYLLKQCPKELEKEPDREKKLQGIFNELFKITAGKLGALELEYRAGIRKEVKSYIDAKVTAGSDQIWQDAIKLYKEKKVPVPFFQRESDEKILNSFHSYFKISSSDYALAEMKKLDGKILSIFKRKKTMEEMVEEEEAEKRAKEQLEVMPEDMTNDDQESTPIPDETLNKIIWETEEPKETQVEVKEDPSPQEIKLKGEE